LADQVLFVVASFVILSFATGRKGGSTGHEAFGAFQTQERATKSNVNGVMPRYFFDFVDNRQSLPGEDGFDLPDTKRVRTESLEPWARMTSKWLFGTGAET
jgi:hypothetical protein